MDGLPKEWYNQRIHARLQIHTDRTVPANKPDIILRRNSEKSCKLIEVFEEPKRRKTPDSQRSGQKAEIASMWGVKAETIPVIVGAALGAMPPHSIKGNLKEETIQEIALCGTAHILRKIL